MEWDPNPATFISGTAFASALHLMTSLGDFMIIDGPPLLPVADSLSLANHVGGVLIVVRVGTTPMRDLKSAVASLTEAGANVVGAVLIGTKQSTKAYEYASNGDVERFSGDELASSGLHATQRTNLFDTSPDFGLRPADTAQMT